ncbi:hypothetical protein PoB_006381200 [Plakobranchus ocellatus]|uniref:Uncharacterized protein n=1 Tax=Plakobranchus ocellatus TaxID=259542 RepID=A0AAV4CZF2_9GAST|nr:hypothetical protein PoB_006381200 [Plakobranchus ocellatus]
MGWILSAKVNYTLYGQGHIHSRKCHSISWCPDQQDNFLRLPYSATKIIVELAVWSPEYFARVDLLFFNTFAEYLVRIHFLGRGPIRVIKAIKTKNVVEGFASFHFEIPSPERLLVLRDQNLHGSFCDKETWCDDRFLWRPHPLNPSSSISVTIDTLDHEDVKEYYLYPKPNESVNAYQLIISASINRYSMGLTKCADLLLPNEKYDLSWDSAYTPETTNFFVLPPGRKISVNTCDMSLKGENMVYWSSIRRTLRLRFDQSSFFSSSNASTIMITFDDQKSMMGVYYLFPKTLDWNKAPDGMFLREKVDWEKERFKIYVPRALSRDPVMYTSTNSFSFDRVFRCDQNTVCSNAISWTAAHQERKDVFIVEIKVTPEYRTSSLLVSEKGYLEWRVSFLEEITFANNRGKYYRLLLFPEGMEKYVTYVLPDASGREVTYSMEVTWTENLADYLFIFPSPDAAGIKCEKDRPCDDQFLFQTMKTFNGSLFVRLDVHIDKSENLSNYTVFLTERNQVDFRIYRFSSRPAYSPTNDPSVDAFSKNSAIVLAVVAVVCLIALATVLTVLIMRSRKVRSRRGRWFFHTI